MDTNSNGMKKQMMIAAAICAGTQYLLCDEDFDGLDPWVRKTVNELLKSAVTGRNRTVFIVSHYLEELHKICTEKGFLHRGKVLTQKEWNDLMTKAGEEA